MVKFWRDNGVIIKRHIISKLSRFRGKFIILSGPRQSGKTFIIKNSLKPDLVLDMDIADERLQFKKFPAFVIDWYDTKIGPFPSDFCFADYVSPRSAGARFECAVACLLRRSLMAGSDQLPAGMTLGFCRDYSKREIDLVVASGRRFDLFIECKADAGADPANLKYFTERFNPTESILAVNSPGVFEKAGNHFIVSAELLAAAV